MSDYAGSGHAVPLGIGKIAGDTIHVLRQNSLALIAIALLPWFIAEIAEYISGRGFHIMLLRLACWSTAIGALTLAAYRIHHGIPVEVIGVLSDAIESVLVLTACAALAVAAIYVATALIIPGLYLTGLWCMIVPAVVIERQGFDCFRRSVALTEGRRWPLVGLWVMFQIVAFAVLSGLMVFEHSIFDFEINSDARLAILIVASSAFNILGSVVTAMTYVRLCEIEDGDVPLNDVFS